MGANFHTKQLNPLFWVLKRCIPMDVMVIGKGTVIGNMKTWKFKLEFFHLHE